jgi:predicted ribosome quality control (RQC) complex YloA/Tae2 family protein
MKVELDLNKSVEENASVFFEKSKKAKAKLSGLQKAITIVQEQIVSVEQKQSLKAVSLVKKRKRDWFEQYHWFFTSDGFLVIGGKDAKQNEEIVKKQMEQSDLYFHADVFGAPHCILKTTDNSAPEQSLQEAAIFAAVFSRAWQSSSPLADVYSVKPEQVSKQAPSGEAIGKGAFMIYGERNWFKRTQLSIAIGAERLNENFRIISGPESAVSKHSVAFVLLQQGNAKKSDAAKKIKSILEKKLSAVLDLDEIVQALPNGEFKILA